MPTIIAYLLYKMCEQTVAGTALFTIQSMVLSTRLGRQTIARYMGDLAIHGVLKITPGYKQGGRAINYSLSKSTVRVIEDTRLFQHYKPVGSCQHRQKRKDRYAK
ncbi:hypothetical protein LCGC14_2050050 [marine sediment metagenome]|uniref:Uncharacterized protein n=1 Tax=marine sediment metagenome TaxID=412755 RepID=A0A0F9H2S2_9ZZZZ